MRLPLCTFAILGLGAVISLHAASTQPQECTQDCLVKIDGLQQTYQRGAHVNISIQNQSKQKVLVIASVEGRTADGWSEVLASVADPNRPFAKLVKATPIKAGAAWTVAYDPWATLAMRSQLLPKAGKPTVLRLVVSVHKRQGLVQRITSEPFSLVSEK